MRQAQPIDRPAAPHTGPPRIKRADDLHRRVSPAFGRIPYETFVSCGRLRVAQGHMPGLLTVDSGWSTYSLTDHTSKVLKKILVNRCDGFGAMVSERRFRSDFGFRAVQQT